MSILRSVFSAVASRRGMAVLGLLAVAGVVLVIVGFRPVVDPAQAPAPLPGDAGLPTPVVTARPPAGLAGDHLSIPALGVEAQLVPVVVDGLRFPVPSDPATVGISTSGAAACSPHGITLLAGHVSSYGVKGALWPLAAVHRGVELYIHCPDGSLATYRAMSAPEVIDKAELDPGLNTKVGNPRLVVVTCGGPVLPNGHYRDNVVASFEFVGSVGTASPSPSGVRS